MTSNKDIKEMSTGELYDTAIICLNAISSRKAMEKHELEPEKTHNVHYGAVVNEISTLNRILGELTLFSK